MPRKKNHDKERKCYMYRITNKVNGHDYIGVTICVVDRWTSHRRDARQNKQRTFARALRSYGPDNFDWKVSRKEEN